jgi:hypothetical protein
MKNLNDHFASALLSTGCRAWYASTFNVLAAMNKKRQPAIDIAATAVLSGLSWRRSVMGVN